MQGLVKELEHVESIAKRAIHLSKEVKKLVALTLARDAVMVILGSTREAADTWSDCIGRLTGEDWDKVGVTRLLVKSLLVDGAYMFNGSIHEIPAAGVVYSIASMLKGFLWSAWKEIFFLAFGERVTDELFGEELHFTNETTALGFL
jgi:hypothetical protein